MLVKKLNIELEGYCDGEILLCTIVTELNRNQYRREIFWLIVESANKGLQN